ncbi:sensor histidine kinase [Desulfurella amilsii]|nr:sensor histidine kinase [Desulfurella amilsii]
MELANPLKQNDAKRIQNILHATIVGSPFIKVACVKTQTGSILCNKNTYRYLFSVQDKKIVKLENTRIYLTKANVDNSSSILIGVSLKDADLFFLDFLKKIILLFLFGGFVLILISIIFLNTFIKPIKVLRKAIESIIHNGNYQQLKVNKLLKNDEIGLLFDSFNLMSYNLQRHEEEIKKQQSIISNLIKRLISIQEEEKKKIARELHDQLSQTLVYVKLQLDILRRNVGYRNEISSLSNLISDELSNIHDICFSLRPITLDTLGLSSALKNFVGNLQKNASFNIHLDITNLDASTLNSEISTCVFRVIQEAVMNSIKYAKPHNIYIHLSTHDDQINGYIKDDGIGFEINDTEIPKKQHFGIVIMKERCAILNGKLNIISKIDEGTTVSFEVPT